MQCDNEIPRVRMCAICKRPGFVVVLKDGYYVGCQKCNHSSEIKPKFEEAVKAWNATQDAAEKELKSQR